MSEEGRGEAFLDRWSRLKRENAKPAEPAAQAKPPSPRPEDKPAAELPPLETLKPDSDFTPFMQQGVDPATRRGALKKLFAGDAHFNLPDPYEAYCEDYTKADPIPQAMMRTLQHAQQMFSEPKAPQASQPAEAPGPQADATPPPAADAAQEPGHVAGRQDA